MIYRILLSVTLLSTSVVLGQKTGIPPTIQLWAKMQNRSGEFITTALKHVQVAVNTESFGRVDNRLRCIAENAKTIKWQFRKDKTSIWSDRLPNVTAVTTFGSDRVELHNGQTFKVSELKEMNGYYRCEASDDEHVSLSATVRVILPYFSGEKQSTERRLNAEEYFPFRLQCLKGHSDPFGHAVQPADVLKYKADALVIQWFKVTDGISSNLEISPQQPRLTVHPKTGDLYYAYRTPNDSIEAEGGKNKLTCKATIGQYTIQDVHSYHTVTTTTSTRRRTPLEFAIQYPDRVINGSDRNVIATPPMKCYEGLICQVACIFGGRQVELQNLVVEKPRNSYDDRIAYTPGKTGFQFTPSATTPNKEMWRCYLRNPDPPPKEVGLSIDTTIEIVRLPRLISQEGFPPKKVVIKGSNVQYFCSVSNSNEAVKLYVNGKLLTDNDIPEGLTYSSNSPRVFSVSNAHVNHTMSVLCETPNEIVDLYSTSILIVYEGPRIVRFPNPPESHEFNLGSSNYGTTYFNCTAFMDNRTTSARIHWMIRLYNNIEEKITGPGDYGVEKLNHERFLKRFLRVSSRIGLEISDRTVHFLSDSKWWCVTSYTILGVKGKPLPSEKFIFDSKPVTFSNVGENYPLLIGVLSGVIAIIFISIVIHNAVKRRIRRRKVHSKRRTRRKQLKAAEQSGAEGELPNFTPGGNYEMPFQESYEHMVV